MMKIVTTMLADEVYEASNDNGNRVKLDMRKRESKTALSPTELVLSALAACAGVEIVSMLRKRKKDIGKFTIETVGTRREVVPKYFTHIHCKYIVTSPNANEEELKKSAAMALEKYCSVASSLKAEITFSTEIIRPA